MECEELKNQICVAAGVNCPEWLQRIVRPDLLREIRELVAVGVVIVSADGLELSPVQPADCPVQYMQRAVDVVRFLKRQ